MQRLYYDVNGFNTLSIEQIHILRSKAKHIFPDPQKYYYFSREELIEDYYKRFAKWFLLRKDLGLTEVDYMDPRNRVFSMDKYALDNGSLIAHFVGFIPAL